AKAFSEEMGGLGAAFGDYAKKWDATTIATDWQGFCSDSRAIIAALTSRITRENRELLPLADRLDRAA
ncbi:MAG: hemerythrin domain-containing protein, partial [Sphingomonadales bacterium]|nr:hemerythrin domain-containing protein [Sphingomonadales bacterium]